LPFPKDKFDLVTAVETQYYWPDLVADMREILRVLKPGGTLVVIAESYGKGKYDVVQGPVMKLLRSANLGVEDCFRRRGTRTCRRLRNARRDGFAEWEGRRCSFFAALG
jgi:SAM-dependent methyltransferase